MCLYCTTTVGQRTTQHRARGEGSGTKNARRAPGQQANDGARGRPEDLLSVIDGRTRTVTLLRIAYKASELLEIKPKAEVRQVEKAMDEADELKRRYEEALALVGDEPPI